MHLQLLRDGRTALRTLSHDLRIRELASPVVFHPDLNKRNIVVNKDDPTIPTCFLDWQSTSIGPAFWVADVRPDFAAIPERSDDLTEDDVATSPDVEACSQAFDLCMQFHFPILATARSLDRRLVRPFKYGHRTWNDGAIAFRHDLIMLSKEWEDLGFEEACPIAALGVEELTAYDKDYRHFVAAQRLRRQVTDYLDISSDGWVPTEAWDTIQSRHRALYSSAVEAIATAKDSDEDEPVKSEDDLKAIWPFDLQWESFQSCD